ncbi:MAG: hypothetical protein IJT06_07275 [Selenomonadaceae bacterium]|nr:hypothetical protein [Selenomonadaceae bacterium]
MSEEKILKSEELTDADLDEVAGGTMTETDSDIAFFDKAKNKFTALKNFQPQYGGGKEMKAYEIWDFVGVDFDPSMDRANQYKIGGKTVTQDQAQIYALRQLKKMK